MELLEFHKRLKKINKATLAALAVEANESLLINLNQDQLRKSKLSTGAAIVPLYSDAYAKKKGTRKPNLHLTGKMDESFEVEVSEADQEYFIEAMIDYAIYNEDRYSDKIYGLTKKNEEVAKKKVTVTFIKLWKDAAGL